MFCEHVGNVSLIRRAQRYAPLPLHHFPLQSTAADANDVPAEVEAGGSGHLVQYSDSDAGNDSTGKIPLGLVLVTL